MPKRQKEPLRGVQDTKDRNKYCFKCEKRISKSSKRLNAKPLQFGKKTAKNAAKYLNDCGKNCDFDSIRQKWFCSVCFSEYFQKHKAKYDKKYGKSASSDEPQPGPSTDEQPMEETGAATAHDEHPMEIPEGNVDNSRSTNDTGTYNIIILL